MMIINKNKCILMNNLLQIKKNIMYNKKKLIKTKFNQILDKLDSLIIAK